MAYVLVGTGHNASNGNTITYTPTPGNYLVFGSFTSAGGGSPTFTVADNGSGSTWTSRLAATTFASSFFGYYSGIAGTSVTIITATYNGGTPGNVFLGLLEFSGLDPAGWLGISTGNLQAVPGNPAGTGTNAVTSNNVNITAQPAALIGWVWELGGNGGGTAGTSPILFTRRLNIGGIMTEDARVTATGNALVTATNSNGAVDSLVTFAMGISEPVTNIITAAVGTFSLAGKAAGLAVTVLPCATGFFSLAGQGANLASTGTPLVILAAPGVFNVSGASALTNYGLDSSVGLFALTGFPVIFGGSGVGAGITAQQASFNYQGFPATFVLATVSAGTITANVGGFVLQGQQVVFTVSNLPPSSSGVLGRPGGRTIFSAKKVSEAVNFIWDFVSSLAPGETILTNQITATIYMGNDTNPAGIVGGPAVVSGTQVFQLILGGLVGQIYGVSCNITTSTGQSITESAYLAIEPDLP